jgi:hypothetical protein
MNFP